MPDLELTRREFLCNSTIAIYYFEATGVGKELVAGTIQNQSGRKEKPLDGIPKSEMEKLLEYPRPGNVHELQSVIERGSS